VKKNEREFVQTVWEHYAKNKRWMPWRDDVRGYYVLVSEIMLQQTQVGRVTELFARFIQKFPDFETLASAELSDVLMMWQGLGYNRRAKFLHQAAQIIVQKYDGVVPDDVSLVDELPGIGPATAAAIVTYIYGTPHPFMETNVRRVYLHHFFADQANVSDSQILPIIQETWSQQKSREWGWALMDYGSYLAKIIPNPNRQSKHYTKQPRFEGSVRQMRGIILRRRSEQGITTDFTDLRADPRFEKAYKSLTAEGLI
jgi:A/G-specific adenine glycosylase